MPNPTTVREVKTGSDPINSATPILISEFDTIFLNDVRDVNRLKLFPYYSFVSTMPYGYGSGALPFFSHPNSGGYPGTSYAPGGYMASSLLPNNNNYQPPPPPPPQFYNNQQYPMNPNFIY